MAEILEKLLTLVSQDSRSTVDKSCSMYFADTVGDINEKMLYRKTHIS
jgi:hypothetical protein